MRLAIIIPTIEGREESLERCIASYERHTDGIEFGFRVYRNSPSSGEGWLSGLAEFVSVHGQPDYVHLTNDDIECANSEWWVSAVEVTQTNRIPAPVVYNSDGSLQSAGGQLGANGDLITELREDGAPVGFTTVPFMSWEQWEQIGMLPIHYSSDVWVSERGKQLGMETVLCHEYELIHHMHQVGRGAGMSQADRAGQDKILMRQALDSR
jgi:hypothetical protein